VLLLPGVSRQNGYARPARSAMNGYTETMPRAFTVSDPLPRHTSKPFTGNMRRHERRALLKVRGRASVEAKFGFEPSWSAEAARAAR
jgi:hypothetical protein